MKGTALDFPFEQLDTYIGVLIENAETLKKHQAKRLIFQLSIADTHFTMVAPFTVPIKDALQKMGQKAVNHISKIVTQYAENGYKCLNTNI